MDRPTLRRIEFTDFDPTAPGTVVVTVPVGGEWTAGLQVAYDRGYVVLEVDGSQLVAAYQRDGPHENLEGAASNTVTMSIPPDISAVLDAAGLGQGEDAQVVGARLIASLMYLGIMVYRVSPEDWPRWWRGYTQAVAQVQGMFTSADPAAAFKQFSAVMDAAKSAASN